MKKNILLGITGGIAAYKMVDLASKLTKMGNNVQVVMTKNAANFVTPTTFQTITHNCVYTDLFDLKNNDIPHIKLAEEADVILVAPATANFIARIAQGMADDLLTSIILASHADIYISPAMNVNMYHNNIVQQNLQFLSKMDFNIITPDSGYLACGTEGEGRLPETEILLQYVMKGISDKKLLNKKILITAGPTQEPLDPVRFLSNYSSGKMGYALAQAAWFQGADVTLVSGPTNLDPPPGIEFKKVQTADEMNKIVTKIHTDYDIIFMVAAVADYRPQKFNKEKIKKNKEGNFTLCLSKNPDILVNIGENKNSGQLIIGFAAESENLLVNARNKLTRKNLDMIIANDISNPDAGFGSEDNQVFLITKNNNIKLPLMKKKVLAEKIIQEVIKLL